VLQYATLFCGILKPKTGTFDYCNAGHPPPYLVRCPAEAGAEVKVEELREGGIPVGMMPGAPYETGTTVLKPGDFVYLFTDGITEAENEEEDLLGEERLVACLQGCAGLDLNNIMHEVLVEVRSFAGETPQDDDVTMVAFRRHH
jgi:sigma-B regulation protein RsbU (phosphoserine phosphatase)